MAKEYRLDRSSFKINTFKEAANQYEYWSQKPLEELLKASWYLTSVAYSFDLENEPRLDRSLFSMKKRP